MKISCEIIADLLPLYEDGVCSEQSRRAVEEHLRECERCRKLLESTQSVPAMEIQPEWPAADKAVARSFKKIRARWRGSLLLVIFLIPVCILGWNQFRREGIHFTNIREIYVGSAFMKQLQKGDYEKAYRYIDVESIREEWKENWSEETTLDEIEADGLEKFCEAAAPLKESGGIQEYRYIGVLSTDFHYELLYEVMIAGEAHDVTLKIDDNGIQSFGCSGAFLDDPFAYFGMWNEWLWEDYEGCYFDPEIKQYIYPENDKVPS